MGEVLHGSATTTEAIRRAIQHRQASLRALARRYGSIKRPSGLCGIAISGADSRFLPKPTARFEVSAVYESGRV